MKSPLRKTKQVSRQQGACLPASVAVTASALQKQHQQKRTSPARTATAQPAPGATEPHAGHRPRWADCTHNRAGQAGLTGDSHAAATAPRHGCTCPSAVKDVAVQTGRSQGRRPQGVLGSRPDKHVCARTPVCPTARSPREAPQVSTRGSPAEGRAFSRQFHGASDGLAHRPPARTSPVARSPPTAPKTTAPHRGDHCPPPKG